MAKAISNCVYILCLFRTGNALRVSGPRDLSSLPTEGIQIVSLAKACGGCISRLLVVSVLASLFAMIVAAQAMAANHTASGLTALATSRSTCLLLGDEIGFTQDPDLWALSLRNSWNVEVETPFKGKNSLHVQEDTLVALRRECDASWAVNLGFRTDLAHIVEPDSPPSYSTAKVLAGSELRAQPTLLFLGGGLGGSRRKSNSFVKLAAQKVGPAVVRLDTERDTPTLAQEVSQNRDHLLRQFFGDGDLHTSGPTILRERGQGSGFVFDGKDGIIITNAHVIKGADRVKVTFTDGRVFEGKVTASDDISDLAVVKVVIQRGEVLPKAILGDSSTVELGDWVIAVGNPFGLENTVSLGIISNLHRTAAEVGIPDKRLDFLQIDCAINPGNSGGPLLNEFGEVIGINTAIRADAEGIAFAIPINHAKKIIEALGNGLPVNHTFLGIQTTTLSPALARHYNKNPNSGFILPEVNGVMVVKVSRNSPAAVGGLRSGDVIVEIEGTGMSNAIQLQQLVETSRVGQLLRLKLLRGEMEMVVTVRTGDMAPFFQRARESARDSNEKSHSGNSIGVFTEQRKVRKEKL